MNKRQKRKQVKKHILQQLQKNKIKMIAPFEGELEQQEVEKIVKQNIRLLIDTLTMTKNDIEKNNEFVQKLFERGDLKGTVEHVQNNLKSLLKGKSND